MCAVVVCCVLWLCDVCCGCVMCAVVACYREQRVGRGEQDEGQHLRGVRLAGGAVFPKDPSAVSAGQRRQQGPEETVRHNGGR